MKSHMIARHMLFWTYMCGVIFILGCYAFSTNRAQGPVSTFTEKSKVTSPDGSTKEYEKKTESKGATYMGDTTKKLDIGGSCATTKGASSESSNLETWEMVIKGSSMYVLYGIALFIIMLGFVVGYLTCSWKLGAIICGGAIAGIAAITLFDKYPWIVLFPALVLLLAGVVLLYFLARGKSFKETLATIVGAIEDAEESDPGATKKTKSNIKRRAGAKKDKVKRDVAEIKKGLKL